MRSSIYRTPESHLGPPRKDTARCQLGTKQRSTCALFKWLRQLSVLNRWAEFGTNLALLEAGRDFVLLYVCRIGTLPEGFFKKGQTDLHINRKLLTTAGILALCM